ncbi:DDE-type integrase/transposase/recombinase [Cryobacterium sp.]|uniref:DDE-type integrase/transposase/recombinase n=1 Tax=Cryobacterium sp. TaxID=1926290 RepID=UPI0026050193|nr:DDE-type integrase/transposase/recombinase [Cryobacterium sp.]MCU1447139.1 Transposase for insertion sequence element [Cryobacterium sp.]
MTETVAALEGIGVPVIGSCRTVGLARSTYYRRSRGYRHYTPVPQPLQQADRTQPAALDTDERAAVIDVLTDEKYADKSVVQTYWRAFDAGEVLCSQRTFYRIAKAERLVGDQRRTRSHGFSSSRTPAAATHAVGDLWSWDITELRGPTRLDRYFLYLAIDVFSRYPVAWCIDYTESKERAKTLFTDAISTHGAPKILHSDNGAVMRAGELVDTLTKTGALMSYSRPRVSDDNPFSESLFKTIKYDPACPDRFDSIDHARQWTQDFLHGYATEHRHGGLGRHTPASVHDGTADQIRQHRQDRLDQYWAEHPERFRRRPTAPQHPLKTGINTRLLSQTG